MLNDTGAWEKMRVPASDPAILYLPYPDGTDQTSEFDFTLYHFMDHYAGTSGKKEPYRRTEVLKGKKTPFGIRFAVTGLSPFVLEWGQPEDPGAVPRTGDSTPLGLLLGLLLCACGGFSVIKKRIR